MAARGDPQSMGTSITAETGRRTGVRLELVLPGKPERGSSPSARSPRRHTTRRGHPLGAWLARLTLLGCCAACGESSENAVCVRQTALIGGEPAPAAHGVFLVARTDGETNLEPSCSATLIAQNLLLTARHCVSPAPADPLLRCGQSPFGIHVPPERLSLTSRSESGDDLSWFAVHQIVIPDEGDDVCGFDLAALVLATPVPRATAEPMQVDARTPPEAGQQLELLGFGYSSSGRARDPNDLQRRRLDARVSCTGLDCGSRTAVTEFMVDALACDGDSGGPALNSAGDLVGVLSRSARDCSQPIYESLLGFEHFLERAHEAAAASASSSATGRAPSARGTACSPH